MRAVNCRALEEIENQERSQEIRTFKYLKVKTLSYLKEKN